MQKWNKKFILGITGGMGSGKSLASKIFQDLGAFRVSSDELARKYTDVTSPIKSELVEIFGPEVLNDKEAPDRNYIAKIVFQNPNKLQQLTSIIHPRVRKDFLEIVQNLPEGTIVAWEAPLLFEAKGNFICNATLTIYANLEVAFQRVNQRDGLSREEFEARIRNQMDIKEKIQLSDFSIRNEGNFDYLRSECEKIYKIILMHREVFL